MFINVVIFIKVPIHAPAHGDQVLPLHRHVPRAAFLTVHRHRGVSACVSGKRTAATGAAVRSAPRPATEPEEEKKTKIKTLPSALRHVRII